MEVYRIHDRRFDALSGMGAALRSGRWNPFGVPVVYTSLAYEGTLLEVLARVVARGIPIGHVASRIHVPEDCRVEVLEEADWPGWHDRARSHDIGREWVDSRHSVALVVPSYVARPWGRNVVLNPQHPDFRAVRVAEDIPVTWDTRLF
ncbi:MAG: RES domain-containing protein [Gemmatimonadetes bacterium]|nr:RES domain-containing protein [Gemmatimonadota bacterium]